MKSNALRKTASNFGDSQQKNVRTHERKWKRARPILVLLLSPIIAYLAYRAFNHRLSAPPSPIAEFRPPQTIIPKILEAEGMTVTKKSSFRFEYQTMDSIDGGKGWSNGAHMMASGTKPGDFIEYALSVAASGTYRITAYLTQGPDFGILRFQVNSDRSSTKADLFHLDIKPTGPIDVGTFKLNAGTNNTLKIVVSRQHNPASKGYSFGIDGFTIEPVK